MTPKQTAFVNAYLVDANATKAAKKAGYSEKTAYSQGQRLLKHVEIARALAKRQERAAEDADITLASHLAELKSLRQLAVADGQFGAAVNAEVKRGEVAGFYVKRTEDVTGMTREQKKDRLLKLLA